jgi:hypothetical protein
MDWITIIKSGLISIHGIDYDLTHLQKKIFPVEIEATSKFQAIKTNIIVTYTSHCTSIGTNKCPVDFDSIGQCYKIVDDRGDERKFDYERYGYSKKLPEIFREIVDKKCYQTIYRNYLVVKSKTNTMPKYYHVFFRIKRTGSCLDIRVDSAYPIETLQTGKNRPIRGSVLLAKTFRRENIRV